MRLAAIAVVVLCVLSGCGADSDQKMLTEGARAAREAASEVNSVRLTTRQLLDGKLWTPGATRMVTDSEEALDKVVSSFDARQPGSGESREIYDRYGDALDAAVSVVRETRIALANDDRAKVRQQLAVLEQAGRQLGQLGESAK